MDNLHSKAAGISSDEGLLTSEPAATGANIPAAGSAIHRMDGHAWSMLGVLSVMWGAAFSFTAVQLRELPPFTIVSLRVGLAALLMLTWTTLARVRLPCAQAWPALVVLALLNNVIPFVLFAFAQRSIPSALAGILNATTPLWGVLVAHLLVPDERATAAKIAGVILGFVGVAAMAGGDAFAGMGTGLLAQLACLSAALCYALAAVWSRKYITSDISPVAISTAQFCAATIVMLPMSLTIDRPWELALPGPTVWMATCGGVLISTVSAYIVYFKVIARVGASAALLVTFTVPVVAIVLGVLFLGEELQPKHFIGMALIALGLTAIDGRAWSRFTQLQAQR